MPDECERQKKRRGRAPSMRAIRRPTMDIMLPPIDEQPAPAPWLIHGWSRKPIEPAPRVESAVGDASRASPDQNPRDSPAPARHDTGPDNGNTAAHFQPSDTTRRQ